MAISADRQHSTPPARRGPAPADETPLQVIESAWYEAGSELTYYGNHRDVRLLHNEGEQAALDELEAHLAAKDDGTGLWLLQRVRQADAGEDRAALQGDGRVVLAQRHGRAVGAAIELAETGRQREDAPEHEAYMRHSCPTCADGGQCRTGRDLMAEADAADFRLIGGGGAR